MSRHQDWIEPARDGETDRLLLTDRGWCSHGRCLNPHTVIVGGFGYCEVHAPPPCARAPSVPDPVADTARALAGLWADANAAHAAPRQALTHHSAIEDAARECGPQVFAAFCALVTGDAGREVGP